MSRIWIGALALVVTFAYQNCGEPFAVDRAKVSRFASLGATGSGGGSVVPSTDKYDASCLTNPAYDACVIQQNPIVRSSGALPPSGETRSAALASQALYGVKLTSLSGSGRLDNPTLSVQSVNTPLANTLPAVLKARPDVAGSSFFEQVNVYYWVNRAAEYFDSRTGGVLPAKNKGVKIIVDDSVTGYDTSLNTIRLKAASSEVGAIGWNGDVAVHLFGVANLMLANPNGWRTLSATTHRTCNAVDRGCCTAAAGCGNAIRFGIGEYFAACLFPGRTRLGDGVVNTGNPQIIGAVARDLTAIRDLSAAQAFASANGFAQSMGLIYASIWWNVRQEAGVQSADIDRLFIEHLSLVGGDDTFRTALEKIRSIDARLFSGRHIGKFETQFAARGL